MLTKHEIQSKSTRQRYAEDLIKQLPRDHDGRNTWLLNYGISIEAQNLRFKNGVNWDKMTNAARTITQNCN